MPAIGHGLSRCCGRNVYHF